VTRISKISNALIEKLWVSFLGVVLRCMNSRNFCTQIKGCCMPWNKKRKHQKLIYSTELGLNKIKNPFFGGNFD
jgi:hypothetical protein